MKYTEGQLRQAIKLIEAFLEDKNSEAQKARTLLDSSLCNKPILQIKEKHLYQKLHEADLSIKAYNALKAANMTTVSDLVNYCNCYGLDRLANLRQVGKKSYEEIRAYLIKISINEDLTS
jgi:DNA-directed RNA polymerase alpha subunit